MMSSSSSSSGSLSSPSSIITPTTVLRPSNSCSSLMTNPYTSPRKRLSLHSSGLVIRPTVTTAMTLQSPNHSRDLLHGLNQLRQSGTLCDYVLETEKVEIPVHKAVMVSNSEYFRAMFMGKMIESREDRVQLQGVTVVGLQAVIDFTYTGQLSLNLENLEEVLAAASHVQVMNAVTLCCQYMAQVISVDNCVDILNLAELYSLQFTQEQAKDYILEHFELVACSDQFKKITASQLASLLECNALKVISEFKLFELVLKWIGQNREERESSVATLMSNVRLPLLMGEELVDKVSRVDLIQRNPICMDLLMEAKDYHIVVSKQPLLQSRRTQVRSEKQCIALCHGESLESYQLESKKHAALRDAPLPLYNPCVCVMENFMYACGGKYDSNANNEIATARCFRYDPRFDVWYELPPMNEARKDFALVVLDRCLYAVAGQDENMVSCAMERFSITKHEWEKSPSLTRAVFGHAAAVLDDRIFVSGGQIFEGICSRVVSFSPKGLWKDEAALNCARINHCMSSVNNSLFVVGGNSEDTYGFPVPVVSIERFDCESHQWTICKTLLNIREAGSCVVGRDIYIVGGLNEKHFYCDMIQRFSTDTDQVEAIDKFPTRIYDRACGMLTLPQYV